MLIYIHREDIDKAVSAIHKEAAEAKDKGDYDTFFELSKKALDMVNNWLKSQGKEYKNILKVV